MTLFSDLIQKGAGPDDKLLCPPYLLQLSMIHKTVLGTTAAKRVLLFIVNRTAKLAFNKPQRIKKMNENITKIKFKVSLPTF